MNQLLHITGFIFTISHDQIQLSQVTGLFIYIIGKFRCHSGSAAQDFKSKSLSKYGYIYVRIFLCKQRSCSESMPVQRSLPKRRKNLHFHNNSKLEEARWLIRKRRRMLIFKASWHLQLWHLRFNGKK